MSEMEDEILKPCPFCGCLTVHRGYQPPILGDTSMLNYYRQCMKCLAMVFGFDTTQEADAAWNLRTK